MRALLAALLILSTAAAMAQDLRRGERVFTRCIACHSLEERGPTPGPSLIGIVGRKAAALPDFEYSPVLLEAGRRGLVWTEEALDRYLTDTEAFLPGSVMGYLSLPNADDRRALIDLLKTAR
ncbi:MAG: c-type cytochrome [Alphaproteobacteria bacterium]|nr:c-type cytochrome [Alphaproteobacteria bacterium]